jgi:hypothetical protein
MQLKRLKIKIKLSIVVTKAKWDMAWFDQIKKLRQQKNNQWLHI